MKHLIDKDNLENILRVLWKEDDGKNSEHRICYNKALQDVQCKIDSLEVKEVEVDLDKELDSMITPELKFHKALPSLFDVAKHFFELGLKVQKGE